MNRITLKLRTSNYQKTLLREQKGKHKVEEDTCYMYLSPTEKSYPKNIKNSYKLISKSQLAFSIQSQAKTQLDNSQKRITK